MSPIIQLGESHDALQSRAEYTYLEHLIKRGVPDQLKINDTQRSVNPIVSLAKTLDDRRPCRYRQLTRVQGDVDRRRDLCGGHSYL